LFIALDAPPVEHRGARGTPRLRPGAFGDMTGTMLAPPPITMIPIGHVRSPLTDKASAPRQPSEAASIHGTIELCSGRGLDDALSGIEAWDHLWVVFVFDRAEGFRPKVLPPRSSERRGVLGTRSPHRPNPIGLSVVRLERVDGTVLHVSGVDMLDGTPVLDLKPYVAYTDSIPDAKSGWLGVDPGPRWSLRFDPAAEEALAWLARHGEHELGDRLRTLLATGPEPHAYRRIRILDGGHREIAVRAWRARFRVEGREIVVEQMSSGYRPKELASPVNDELALHRAFVDRPRSCP
jgi:tRNA (adenine37-N6)-methyltransferase